MLKNVANEMKLILQNDMPKKLKEKISYPNKEDLLSNSVSSL